MIETTMVIAGLKNGDSSIIQSIYEDSFKYCATAVTRNHGQMEDARDLFQEAIMVLFKQAQNENFLLTCTVRTYLYSVVRNLWLKRLRKTRNGEKATLIDEERIIITVPDQNEEEGAERERKYGIVDRAIMQIKEDCQKLLKKFYFEKRDLKSLAVEMDYTYQFIKVKKNRCMNALRQKVTELKMDEHEF